MKRVHFITALALTGLTACTQLSAQDRALITSAGQNAEAAKQQSIQATEEARAAREDANRAAKAAQNASDKADRIFREGQNK